MINIPKKPTGNSKCTTCSLVPNTKPRNWALKRVWAYPNIRIWAQSRYIVNINRQNNIWKTLKISWTVPWKMNVHLMGCDGKEGAQTEGADVEHTAHPRQGSRTWLETRCVSQRRRRNTWASKLGLYCARPQILDIGVYMYQKGSEEPFSNGMRSSNLENVKKSRIGRKDRGGETGALRPAANTHFPPPLPPESL